MVLCAFMAAAPRLDAQTAAPLGTWFAVNGTTWARHTDVAFDTQNRVYLMVWSFAPATYGRFVSEDGVALGPGPFKIPVTAATTQSARVAYSPDANAFMVVWWDNRDSDNLPRIYGRSLSYQPDGSAAFIGADFPVSAAEIHYQTPPAIGYSTTSREFLVVYPTFTTLAARRMAADGTPLSAQFDIAGAGDPLFPDNHQSPSVGYSPVTNEFTVAWEMWIGIWDAGVTRAKRVKAGTGELLGSVDLDPVSRSFRGPTSISYDSNRNRFLVAFYRTTPGGPTFGRFVNADGTVVGTEPFSIATTGTYVSNGLAYNPLADSFFCAFPHASVPETYGVEVLGSGAVGVVRRLTTVSTDLVGIIGVDYSRVAASTDRTEWLVSQNAYTNAIWDKAIGQRIRADASGSVFTKVSPASGSSNQPSSVTLSWSAVTNGSYEICYDTVNNNACDTGWQSIGLPTSAQVSGLADGTYYWQVRNVIGGTTEANGGSWWSFAVGSPATPPFGKTSPSNGAAGVGSPVTFSWQAAASATSYQICVDTAADGSCTTTWTGVGAATTYTASLATGTYAWQVRAYNGVTWLADGGAEWAVSVTGAAALFTKTSPSNGAVQPSPLTLSWSAAPGATGYTVCLDATDDASCTAPAAWMSTTGTSYTTGALAAGTYYWQVRATTGAIPPPMADNGTWFSVTVGDSTPAVPGAFIKTFPSNGASGQTASFTLTWNASSGATSYQVCVDAVNNATCDTSWQSVGASTNLPLTSQAAGTYYWQVRAINSAGSTDGNAGTWWSYTVVVASTNYVKVAPAYAATGLGTAVALSWSAVTDASYQVCLSSTGPACDGAWWPTAAATSRTFENLAAGTYYWQARANVGGTLTEADNGTWWAFVVGTGSAANMMGKLTPMNGVTVSRTVAVNFSWGAVAGATYEVCIDSTNNNTCDGTWSPASSTTFSRTMGSVAGGTYYWQVRAVVGGVRTEANVGAWWSIVVPPAPAPLLTKSAPANGAIGQASTVTLSWTAVTNASYGVCLDTTNNNTCDGAWWPTAIATSRTFENLAPATYYWQARATVDGTTTEADNGEWRSFTVGSVLSGAPNGSWVFAEGANGLAAGFTTYYVIANENAEATRVRGWIFKSDGTTFPFEQLIPGRSRATIDVSTIVNGATGEYSAVIQSADPGRQIYVGRSMYWGGTGGIMTGPGHQKIGTLVAPGATLPTQWFFAEGARVWTLPDWTQFAVYYMVFNPNETAASVTLDFFSDTGGALLQTVAATVPPRSRWTVSAADFAALSGESFSARVTSTQPVVAERSMYWGASWSGGHAGTGAPSTATNWYFAEGTAMTAFETYYVALNASSQPITLNATYQLSPRNGVPQAPVLKTYTLAPNSRKTVHLFSEVGYQPGVSASFTASAPIMMERSMYWGANWTEGSNAIGSTVSAAEWHLPEGSSKSGYETYLLISNPNATAVVADITTWNDIGLEETQSVTVAAKTRLTLWMNNQDVNNGVVFATIPNNAFSIRVASSASTPLPIVVEEATYWNRVSYFDYWIGGDATLGFPVIR
jgi:hypothetical protein